ncbi:type VII secretion target [Nocardia thailandica]|uniref:Type VII secretion target n=1 Tax=Nocardia thailandica TaxID=257275 RepID=A0ABW6PHL8_9NOCA
MTDKFNANPSQIAGVSNLYRTIADDLSRCQAYAAQHTSPGTNALGSILNDLMPSMKEFSVTASNAARNYSTATGNTSVNLNRAAWTYHKVDVHNYNELNTHTHTIAGTGGSPDQASSGITEAYVDAETYNKPNSIELAQPDATEEQLVKMIEDKSGWLGDLNEGVRYATDDKWSPLGQLFSPIEGNWSELRRLASAYRTFGNAMEDCSKNVTWGMYQVSSSWDGKAAVAFEDYAQSLSGSVQWWGPVGRAIDHILTITMEEVTAACMRIATNLKEMLEAEVDMSSGTKVAKVLLKKVPVVGTSVQVASLANICLKTWELIKPVVDKIKDLVSTVKKFIDKLLGKGKEPSTYKEMDELVKPFTTSVVSVQKAAALGTELQAVSAGRDSQTGDQSRTYSTGTGSQPWEDN